MKRIVIYIIIVIALILETEPVFSQCTPGNIYTCPDPENNGQICPRTLMPAIVGLEYMQEFTILPPPKIDTLGLTIPLHHINLLEIGNLPEGLTWASNAEKNEFMVGTYYCVKLSGITYSEPGTYPLKISVEAFAKIEDNIITLEKTVDSTSLYINVEMNPNEITEISKPQLISNIWPNPFSATLNIELFNTHENESVIKILNLNGKCVYCSRHNEFTKKIKADLSFLTEGVYILSVQNNEKRQMKLITKINGNFKN
jgi:hypothetical protein